jgi:hypothetical protein
LKFQRIVALIAIGMAAFLLWVLWTDSDPPPAPSRGAGAPATGANVPAASQGSKVVAIPDRGPAVVAGTGTDVPAARPVASGSLRDQIRLAFDLRAVYERFKDSPDPSGVFSYHMAEALADCAPYLDKNLDELIAHMSTVQGTEKIPKRNETLKWSFDRCKGFEGMGAAAMARLDADLYKRAEAAGYPAAVARSLYMDASRRSVDQADTVAITLLTSYADADVVRELYQYLNVRNGGQWPPGGDAPVWGTAWSLLTCSYGGDCGPQNRVVVATCIVAGACTSTTLEESLLASGTSPDTLRRGAMLRDDMLARIRERDWVGIGFIRKQ